MDSFSSQRPAPASSQTVLTLLNPLNKGEIGVPGPTAESMATVLSRLPASLRPIVSKVFATYRSRSAGRNIPVSEFKALYEKVTAVPQLVVTTVQAVKRPHMRTLSLGKSVKGSGEASPTRSVLTTAPSLGSPKAIFSLNPFPATPSSKAPRKTLPIPSLSYAAQHQRKRASEQVQTERDYETVQALTRNLNQSFTAFINSQIRLSEAETKREELLRIRKKHLKWSQSMST